MKPDVVLKAGTLAGKILLESGAETIRVEETVTRICEAFLVVDANAFATPTGLFVSFDYEDETYSKVLRIKGSGINLEKINSVNDVSRKCNEKLINEIEAYDKLKIIAQYQGYSSNIKLIASGFAALFFTLFFGGSFFDGCSAFLIGVSVQYIGASMERKNINAIVKIMILSAMLTCLTLIMTYIGLVDSKDKVIIGSLMLLVPGVAITNAVRDSISGDLLSGATRAIEAFLIAIALALGAGVVLSLWMLYIGGGV
ncbi:uncharacterized membrane protein YjjP (DUF1212 family) [Breznakia sp. PF5-3]|uniref:threonine/serine exporter family protein n=1 Tax=unclassified Breznakia TaxID=2623764 RepID=UPI00240660DA|nr:MULTISPECIES: threonine/serine exporter family protein [unclassified Breznakia]MDF9824178.1 uncharacterized membrane protein YjjP (DUF1212 family) [Breznakia sp. PM6-1]MDF9834976.1 uncharacterized membrane protein YjjP (DUF1212 family) [Breznakia sp. PF5-3]MDF9837155.1 uncharacterized membrane protein YjjP (DUF1212 family) [Breznakia sp. PFB2-8]MDF9859145.1 uncharacterized membrane protein YjjP (DUF1212 family) [Breznakia sp. PH5-24]